MTLPLCIHTYASDEWIGLQPETSWAAGLYLNHYEAGDTSRNLFVFATLPRSILLNVQLGSSTLEDNGESFDSNNYYAQLGWSAVPDIDVGISYQFEGQSGELEIEQLALQMDWNPYPAFFTAEISRGDVYIFTRDITPPIRDIRNRIQSDIDSYTLGIGYWFEAFSLSARVQRYDYELNLSALSTNPVLQILLQPGALAQTGLLVSEQSSITLTYPLEKRDLSWHLFITQSALDNTQTRALQFDWSEQLNKNSSLFVSLNRTDEEKDNWSFGVGLEWNS